MSRIGTDRQPVRLLLTPRIAVISVSLQQILTRKRSSLGLQHRSAMLGSQPRRFEALKKGVATSAEAVGAVPFLLPAFKNTRRSSKHVRLPTATAINGINTRVLAATCRASGRARPRTPVADYSPQTLS